MEVDTRWEQIFSNFLKALEKLQQSVDYITNHCSPTNFLVHLENSKDKVAKSIVFLTL
jgi:hypothetical protein